MLLWLPKAPPRRLQRDSATFFRSRSVRFSRFFIDRPIFAVVLSLVILAGGLIAVTQLPISEYPEVTPPTITVSAIYPGANPSVLAQTVGTPLEDAITGAGPVIVFGAGAYAMRVWLDPNRVASHGLSAGDVVQAIREQNLQVAAGTVGAPPVNDPVAYQLTVVARGRLTDEKEFGNIIVKTSADGAVTRLRDVARIELGPGTYGLRALLDNKPAVAVVVFQAPGSNALALSSDIRAKMADLKTRFPQGVEWSSVYDPTLFVRDSIREVIYTLLLATLMVVIVVVLFLQTWRASIIPLVAVPISIVGTFAVMLATGFSINTLSLFGLVLAIGIVVDDAIVVVENVERHIEEGLSPLDASHRAMDEVSGPIIAIALVLCAVFVPVAFISGLTGQFYRQFALTIAFSTLISAFNSLTLSPALAAVLLKPRGAPEDP